MRRTSADEILIPFAKDYLRRVDVDAKRVELALPNGLLDLNDPKRSSRGKRAARQCAELEIIPELRAIEVKSIETPAASMRRCF